MLMDKRPVVIFGCESFASLVCHCIVDDSPREVAGFTVDEAYRNKKIFEGLPVVPFENIEKEFPPAEFDLIIAFGAAGMNGVRKAKFEEGLARGYRLASYVSSSANISRDFSMGEHCMIFSRAVIEPGVKLGNNIYVRSGVSIGHHSVVGDHCFIAAGSITGGNVSIGERCFLGLGTIIRDNITIADRCLIGAGAVVVKNTEEGGIYTGIPAVRGEKTSGEVM
jgi:sugar O-acyltransferase (sialic acid O-acetyltransferase NeuD family)